ncbi:MAG TPA: hypothetical protein VHR39_12920 [Propionibacteriaceae bacterium]|nr:hypothetical protein [Propionibacteriaceae bacterium]
MSGKRVTRCPRCGVVQPVSAFYSDKSKSNGRRFICKACDLDRSKSYYERNRERKLALANARNARIREQKGMTQ